MSSGEHYFLTLNDSSIPFAASLLTEPMFVGVNEASLNGFGDFVPAKFTLRIALQFIAMKLGRPRFQIKRFYAIGAIVTAKTPIISIIFIKQPRNGDEP